MWFAGAKLEESNSNPELAAKIISRAPAGLRKANGMVVREEWLKVRARAQVPGLKSGVGQGVASCRPSSKAEPSVPKKLAVGFIELSEVGATRLLLLAAAWVSVPSDAISPILRSSFTE